MAQEPPILTRAMCRKEPALDAGHLPLDKTEMYWGPALSKALSQISGVERPEWGTQVFVPMHILCEPYPAWHIPEHQSAWQGHTGAHIQLQSWP